MAPLPAPKRRNLEATRTRILQAAADTFANSGYAKAGLREIGLRAGIAPSLVSRYFGSKAALFEQALIHVLRTNSVFTETKQGFGEAMARMTAERGNANITIMLVLALADPEARAVVQQVTQEHMIRPLIAWLGPPDAEARAMAMFALLSGFAVQLDGLHDGVVPERALQWLATTLQAIVDEGADG